MRDSKHFGLCISFLTTAFLCVSALMPRPVLSCDSLEKSESLARSYGEWYAQGVSHEIKGGFSGAADAFRIARVMAVQIGDGKRQVECLMKLGDAYWNLGELGKSEEAYGTANALAWGTHDVGQIEKTQLALDVGRCYSDGKKYCNSFQYPESIDCFARGIQLSRRLRSPTHEAKCLRWMSVAYFEQNDLKKFFELNQQALQIYSKLKNDRERAYCLYNIGLYYKKRIDIPLALKYFFDALDISQKLKINSSQIDCNLGLGDTFADLGDYNKAITFYFAARKKLDKRAQIADYPNYFLSLGVLYRRKADCSNRYSEIEKALDCYYEALSLVLENGDKKFEAFVLNNIGFALIKLGKFEKGLSVLRSGYLRATHLNNSELMASLQINRGNAFLGLANFGEASRCFKNGIRLSLRTNARHLLWESYWGLGRCFDKMSDISAAETCYRNSLGLIDQMWNKLNLESDKAGFVRDKIGVYESLMDLLYKQFQNHPGIELADKMLSVMERAKARAFLENIQCIKLDSWQDLSPQMQRSEAMISRKISSLMCALSQSQPANARRENLYQELNQWEESYTRLMDQVWPAESRLFRREPDSLSKIQSYLHDHRAALLEYFLGEERSYVVCLTERGCDIGTLPSRTKIEDSIKVYIKVLSTPPTREFEGRLAARRLFRELLFPLKRTDPGKTENLIIVPDGLLYYLPFETLANGSDPSLSPARYLLESYNVSYAPSATSLLLISGEKRGPLPAKGLLALGDPDYRAYGGGQGSSPGTPAGILREIYLEQGFSLSPLPFTQKEVRDISFFFPKGMATVLLRKDASEEAIKQAVLTDYRVLHFACHGFLDEQSAMRSALVLAPTKDWKEDGFLQVREIYRLRTNADLVVLSACQTGRGSLEKGEGPMGLPRVFFYIGARSVVSALWQIADQSTSLLMKDFYSGLARGLSKSRALREAKLRMLASSFAHPFYWGAFVLNGEFDSTVGCR